MKSKLHDKCITCGRKLTIHEHKQRGFGPECWNKVEKKDLHIDFLSERGANRMLDYDCDLDMQVAQAITKAEIYDDDFVVISTFCLSQNSSQRTGMKAILLGHKKNLQISIDEKLPNHLEINPLRLKERKYVPLAYVYADEYSGNCSIVCHTNWEMKVSLLDTSTVWYEPIFTNQRRQEFENADLGFLKKLVPSGATTMYVKVNKNKLDYDYFYERGDESPMIVKEWGDSEWRDMMDDIFPEIETLLTIGEIGTSSWAFEVDIPWVKSIYEHYGILRGFWADTIMDALENGKTYNDFANTIVGEIWWRVVQSEAYIVAESFVSSIDIEEHAIEIWESYIDPGQQIEDLSKDCFEQLFEAIRKH